MILGDHEGALYFLDRQMELRSFRAYEMRVTHAHQMKQHNVLVTVGVSSCLVFSRGSELILVYPCISVRVSVLGNADNILSELPLCP